MRPKSAKLLTARKKEFMWYRSGFTAFSCSFATRPYVRVCAVSQAIIHSALKSKKLSEPITNSISIKIK
jgi:hypothetical protein